MDQKLPYNNIDIAGVPGWILDQLDRISGAFFFIVDYEKGEFLYASASAKQVTGYDITYYMKNGADAIMAICHPEDVSIIQHQVAIYLHNMAQSDYDHNQLRSYTFEARTRHPDGHWIWIESEAYPLLIKEGKMIMSFAIFRDITVRKTAEKFLWDELMQREANPAKRDEIAKKHKALTNPVEGMPFPKELVELSLRTHPLQTLSQREKEVIKLIAKGYTSKKIAEELGITEHTAETHRKNILLKFNVSNTAELIKEANRSYWLGN